jgi:hypothetical protein
MRRYVGTRRARNLPSFHWAISACLSTHLAATNLVVDRQQNAAYTCARAARQREQRAAPSRLARRGCVLGIA